MSDFFAPFLPVTPHSVPVPKGPRIPHGVSCISRLTHNADITSQETSGRAGCVERLDGEAHTERSNESLSSPWKPPQHELLALYFLGVISYFRFFFNFFYWLPAEVIWTGLWSLADLMHCPGFVIDLGVMATTRACPPPPTLTHRPHDQVIWSEICIAPPLKKIAPFAY